MAKNKYESTKGDLKYQCLDRVQNVRGINTIHQLHCCALVMSNQRLEFKTPCRVTEKNRNYFNINLTKAVKGLYLENYNVLPRRTN